MTNDGGTKVTNNQAKLDLQTCLFKELDLIQGVINRMASNSFLLKGWTVTLIVVALAIRGTHYQAALGFVPLVGFWLLDSYYVWQERLYRKLYEWVTMNRLSTSEYLFSLEASRFKNALPGLWKTIFSKTLLCFYGLVAVLLVVYVIVDVLSKKGG